MKSKTKAIVPLIGILVYLISCGQQKENLQDSKEHHNSATTAKIDSENTDPALENSSTVSEGKMITDNKAIRIDFPLDSLLAFDSEAELTRVFGENVKRSKGYYPEGMGEYQNTLLFPGTPNEVEFIWLDDTASFSRLSSLKVSGKSTSWKTRESITIGTTLKELEKLNKKAFTFYGFEWDYSGMTDWEDGHLFQRKVFVNLYYPDGDIPSEYEGLSGDHQIHSSSELAQKVNPVVAEIIMRRED